MEARATRTFCLLIVTTFAVGLADSASAQCVNLPEVTGRTLQTRYFDTLNTIQNNGTGFGNAAPVNLNDTEGSELDRLFITNSATHLYLGITGNTPRNDVLSNSVIVFIDTDAGATPTVLNTIGFTGPNISQALKNMSGVTLDFDPDYAVVLWNDIGLAGSWHGVRHTLSNPTDSGVLLTLGTDFAVDDTNLLGVSATPSDDPLQQQVQADSAVNGFEIEIELVQLSLVSTSPINVQAIIVNTAGSVSNQSLPPLNATAGAVGGGVACLGIHGSPVENQINFNTTFPSSQFVAVTLSPANSAPILPIDGIGIPAPATGYPAGTQHARQNNYTCFGDAAAFNSGITGGNELDLMYVQNDFAKLYIGLTGQVELADTFRNVILIFIETSSTFGLNFMITGGFPNDFGPGIIQPLDGFTFDAAFTPNFVVQIWRQGGQTKAIIQNIDDAGTETPLVFAIDAATHTNIAINAIAADLTNIDGVNDIAGDDPVSQTTLAKTAKKGVQVSLVLQELGIASPIGQSVKVMAMIASASDGGTNAFISNQCLPPFNPTPGAGTPVLTSDTFTVNTPITDAAVTFSTQTATNAAALDRVTAAKVTVNLTHPDVSQLKVELRHDDTGRRITLFDASGTGANMTNTVFMQGGTALTSWVAGGTGTWQPVDSLLTFNGVDPNPSTWTLIVEDKTAGQTGTLVDWKLDLQWDKGGAVACVGTHNTDILEGTVNIVDLGNVTLFPGDQYITKNLVNAAGPIPAQFKADDVPAYFGDSSPTRPNALAVQNNHTCFGNATGGSPQASSGNEIDQLFIKNTEDRIQVAISGNQETNGNGVVILLDTVAGGENTLAANPSPPGSLGGDPMNQLTAPGLNGLILDTDFSPDYAVTLDESGGRLQVHLTNLVTNINRVVGIGSFNSGNGFLEAAVVGGSEMDQLYIMNDATNLYLGFTGNIEGNNNGYVIFLDTIGGGTNTLSTAGGNGWPAHLVGMSGDTLPTTFLPDYALVVSRSGAFYNDTKLVTLANLPLVPTNIPFAANFTISPNTFVGNNNNVDGVNAVVADDPVQQAINAATATTGVQLAIARNSIGSPADNSSIKVYAVVTGSSGFWSNQVMPPLGGGVNNLGAGPVNQSAGASLTYTVNPAGTAPTSYNGQNIPTNMTGLAATQNNFTQFGNQIAIAGSGNANCMQMAMDNSNLGGVTACTCPCLGAALANAGTVDTGYEVDISLLDLGLTGPIGPGNTPTIKVMAVLSGNTGYMSNQFLPGIGSAGQQCNLGFPNDNQPPPTVHVDDLNTYAGNQFLTYTTVVPCSGIIGDVDGDGDRDLTDVTTLVNVLLGSDTVPCHVTKADVSGDTFRDGRDIRSLIQAFFP
ncbi:MAG: dockerin type I domain-containing protein [Planctomycetota bacterium]